MSEAFEKCFAEYCNKHYGNPPPRKCVWGAALAEVEEKIIELFEHEEHVCKIEILESIRAMKEGK
jgi:hypothetical protein